MAEKSTQSANKTTAAPEDSDTGTPVFTPATTPDPDRSIPTERFTTPPPEPSWQAQADELPPPAYSENPSADSEPSSRDPPGRRFSYGNLHVSDPSINTDAQVDADGRVSIRINEKSSQISSFLAPALRTQLSVLGRLSKKEHPSTPPVQTPPPGYEIPQQFREGLRLNIVIQIIGSRGDVQPFIALAKVLQAEPYRHRVRIATHATFKQFVEENGVEFFCIGGDPAELMAYMVRNPGLMPGVETLKSGEVRKRRRAMAQMLEGEWRSCVESGDGMGGVGEPFVADAIIANPPSFGHIHCAERLGVRLHLMFTMPWSSTQAFPHPLANISSSNMEVGMTNYLSYILVEMMTWQGLGDIVNRFRTKVLGLDGVSTMWAPTMVQRLKIPHTYCWSPALIPKPHDWGQHIHVSGFFFLSSSSNYQPPPELQRFLDTGPPPVYIGFGSIVVDDPNGLTAMILEAIRMTGVRAIVSKGWGGLGSNSFDIPENVLLIDNCPHDWLFKRVSAVVHHGGAGTTAIGLTLGCPTVIVPFFGDQPFWGAMVHKRGVGPAPIPFKELTARNLANAIHEALLPEMKAKAKVLGEQIISETGTINGAAHFQQDLDIDSIRSDVDPSKVAVFIWKKGKIKLSARAAELLISLDLIDRNDLRLHRHITWQADEGPVEPISGGASALLGSIGSLMMGVGDFPVQLFNGINFGAKKGKEKGKEVVENVKSNGSSVELTREGEQRRSMETAHTTTTENSVAESSKARSSLSAETSISSPPEVAETEERKKREKEEKKKEKATLKDVQHGERALENIVIAGAKAPMEFTLSLAKGFHNAPLLYGDNTVRPQHQVTGIKSGIKAAVKGVGYGLYDGITGLVTHPLDGARKEGGAGFVKGIGKGVGGLILKPGAGFWGVPGYAMAGLDKEIGKMFGNPIDAGVTVHHFNQGIEEAEKATPAERNYIIETFLELQAKKKAESSIGHKLPRPKLPARISSHLSRHASSTAVGAAGTGTSSSSTTGSPRPSTSTDRSSKPQSFCLQAPPYSYLHANPPTQTLSNSQRHAPALPRRSTNSNLDINEDDSDLQYATDLSAAIAASVQETSRGNDEEDELIARAIRASIAELGKSGDVEAAARRAREESTAAASSLGGSREAQDTGIQVGGSGGGGGDGGQSSATPPAQEEGGWDEKEIERAIAESLRGSGNGGASGSGTR